METNEKIESIIKSYLEDKMTHLDHDRDDMRQYLLTKTLEELGEYAEVIGMLTCVTKRKAKKHNLLNEDGILSLGKLTTFINTHLKDESGDLVWMALSIAFLEGHTLESLAEYLESRKR